MPNCFQLTRKGYSTPTQLQTIDAELCQHLGLPFSEDKWTCNWYNLIGFSLASGHSFGAIADAIKEGCIKDDNQKDRIQRDWGYDLLRINHYLNEHYTSDALAKIGRH